MSPKLVLPITGGFLRPLSEKDVHQDYIDGLNDLDVNRYLNTVKYSKQTKESVISFVTINKLSLNSILWGIWSSQLIHHIGTVRLHNIDHDHRIAYIGVCIFDKSFWGKGFASQAISVVTRWAFDILKLRWVEATIYDENLYSQRVFLKAGYKWINDIHGKYLLEGIPVSVRVYVSQN